MPSKSQANQKTDNGVAKADGKDRTEAALDNKQTKESVDKDQADVKPNSKTNGAKADRYGFRRRCERYQIKR
jgi:hypothetical protein